MALQGGVLDWVADHRKHHAHTDQEGDPHSPHVGHGEGLKGLWHAHTGWLFETHGQADWKRYAKELYEDPVMKKINRLFPLWAFLSLAVPTLLGWALHGFTAEGALRGLVWGGLVRAFFLHHITWSINSVCHYFGRRRFDVEDQSTNVAWLAIPSFGESWHHNHHAFPRSAAHGMKWYEIDVSDAFIRGMEKVGPRLQRRPHLGGPSGGEARRRHAAGAAGGRGGRAGEEDRRREGARRGLRVALARPRARRCYQRPATARASRRGGSSRTTGVAKVRFAAEAVRDEEVETAAGRQGRCW